MQGHFLIKPTVQSFLKVKVFQFEHDLLNSNCAKLIMTLFDNLCLSHKKQLHTNQETISFRAYKLNMNQFFKTLMSML
jgi:hypothetical protein